MYAHRRQVSISRQEAVQRTREELRKEGFGVLTEIDVRQTLKEKLDVDFDSYIMRVHRLPSGGLLAENVPRRVGNGSGAADIQHDQPARRVEVGQRDPAQHVRAYRAAIIRYEVSLLAGRGLIGVLEGLDSLALHPSDPAANGEEGPLASA